MSVWRLAFRVNPSKQVIDVAETMNDDISEGDYLSARGSVGGKLGVGLGQL
jgi:hypothetical protein